MSGSETKGGEMDEKTGIMFSEVMSGGFALGETDPEAGAERGKAEVLTMHGAVTIEDLDAFIRDPQHLGRLDVRMDWATFGKDLPALGGIFNLFTPTRDPNLKLMIYEWSVQHENKFYYFAGEKDIKVHPLFDVWKDTTTLYTKVHEGVNKTGRVVGAGILSLSPAELMKMCSTMTALNVDSIGASLRATAKFGRFFLGEIWDTYVKK